MTKPMHCIGYLTLTLAVVATAMGCATTGSMKSISTHDLQDRFLVSLMTIDGISDVESKLYSKRLSSAGLDTSHDDVLRRMAQGLRTELSEASVVGETRAFADAYAARLSSFHEAIVEVVSADGRFSDEERTALVRYVAETAPLLGASNADTLEERIKQATGDGVRASGSQELSRQFWNAVKLDLLLVDGLNQGEYDRLLSAGLIDKQGKASHLGLKAADYEALLSDPAKASAYRMTDEALRGYARHLESGQVNPLYLQGFEYMTLDEAYVSEDEFLRYNLIAKTVTEEAKRLVTSGELAEEAAITLTPLLRDDRFMTRKTVEQSIPLEDLSQIDIMLTFIVDVSRADGFSEMMLKHWTRPDYNQAFKRASSYIDHFQEGWGPRARKGLLLYVLKSMRGRRAPIARSLVNYWGESIAANGLFSDREKEVLKDYFGGFQVDGPERTTLLQSCKEPSWLASNAERADACVLHFTEAADGLNAYYEKITLPEHAESNPFESMARQMKRGMIEDIQEPARREIVVGLRGIMAAQRAYQGRYEAALASKEQASASSSGRSTDDVSSVLLEGSFERQAFSAEERFEYFLKNQHTLRVPGKHHFRAVYTKSKGYQRYLRKSDVQAKTDVTAIVDAARKSIEGFGVEAERIFGDPVFREDEYGFAHGRFTVDATDQDLEGSFWVSGLEKFHLEAEDLSRLRALKPGEVSDVLVGTEPYTSHKLYVAIQYLSYEPPTTGWKHLRHSDVLNQAMWKDAERKEALRQRDEVLKHPYPLAAAQFPKRESGYSLVKWDSVTPESGNFERLNWHPRAYVDKGRGIAGSYWIEVELGHEGSKPRFVIYGRASLPGNLPDLMYSLASDQDDPVLIEGNPKP